MGRAPQELGSVFADRSSRMPWPSTFFSVVVPFPGPRGFVLQSESRCGEPREGYPRQTRDSHLTLPGSEGAYRTMTVSFDSARKMYQMALSVLAPTAWKLPPNDPLKDLYASIGQALFADIALCDS